jgi:hypothetical protein
VRNFAPIKRECERQNVTQLVKSESSKRLN